MIAFPAGFRHRVLLIGTMIEALGFFQALYYIAQWFRMRGTNSNRQYMLSSKRAAHPLHCRAGTSDVKVFSQIFIHSEYSCLDDIEDADGLILDCGANVGYASAYFLSRFSRATVVAVEPDPGNFALLEENLAPYAGRYRAVQSAVWSHPADLVINEVPYRDGLEWTRQVRPIRPGENAMLRATDIGSLLRDSGFSRIHILKVDIERAEAVVFASNYEKWIGSVDNIVIELHDDECRDIFLKAISAEAFDISESGEMTICRRRPR